MTTTAPDPEDRGAMFAAFLNPETPTDGDAAAAEPDGTDNTPEPYTNEEQRRRDSFVTFLNNR